MTAAAMPTTKQTAPTTIAIVASRECRPPRAAASRASRSANGISPRRSGAPVPLAERSSCGHSTPSARGRALRTPARTGRGRARRPRLARLGLRGRHEPSRRLRRLRLGLDRPVDDQAEVDDRDLQHQHHEDELPDHRGSLRHRLQIGSRGAARGRSPHQGCPSPVEPPPQPGTARRNQTSRIAPNTTAAASHLRTRPARTARSVAADPEAHDRVLVRAEPRDARVELALGVGVGL
jgi:hypothetical protein